MTKSTAWALAALVLLAWLPACGEGEEVEQIQEGLTKTWSGVKAWTAKRRVEAEAFFTESLDGLETQWAAAKEKAAEMGGDASEKLKTSWADVSQKLADLKTAGEGEWEKARDAFVAAYEAFQKQLR